jgi:phage/plasmid-like protein (TIGR03299 family)
MRTLPTNFGVEVSGTDIKEWARKADLDWEAKSMSLSYRNQGKHFTSSRKAIIRGDNGTELGIVSPKYKVVQPIDILETFRQASESYGFKIDRIGSHDDGRIIWGRADAEKSFRVKGQDKVDGYLYIITSYDGSVATKVMISSVRAICMNALHVVSKGSELRHSWRHSSHFDVEQSMGCIDAYMSGWDTFKKNVERMSEVTMTEKEVTDFVLKALQKSKVTERVLNNVMPYIKSAYDSPGSDLTSVKLGDGVVSLWGALNGVTYAVDHLDSRGESNPYFASFGSGSDIKTRAYDAALKLAA